jgi:ABC-2 type transport system ATP-binding protein
MIRSLVHNEGRTVFLSSHLLDEVERVCDHVAIVNGGRVIVQGSVAELTNRSGHEAMIAVDNSPRALAVLEDLGEVREASESRGALWVRLNGDADALAHVNAALVHAGVCVTRLEPTRHSLEERFLQITQTPTEMSA